MEKLVPLETAQKILSDVINNTYTDITVISSISDFLKTLTLSYAYGEGNSEVIYDFIYGRRQQEEVIDFLYEVYYSMQSYGYGEEYLKDLKSSVTKYMSQSNLSEQIKGMAEVGNNNATTIDILFGVFVFLRLFMRQLDAELIKRNNQEQKLNVTKQ